MSCKAGKVCSVYFCNEYEWQYRSVSFFTFPRDEEICAEWVRLSQRADLDNLLKKYGPQRLRNNKICAKHFQPSDFKNPNLTSQGLKKKAVPSLNLSGWEDEAQRRRRTAKIRMMGDNVKDEDFLGKIEGEMDAICISGSMENLPEVKTETIWVEETKIQPEEPHEFLLPLNETVCKTEETSPFISDTPSLEHGVEEDTKEETLIKDEKLMSPSEEASALPLSIHETRSEEIVPAANVSVTSCARIGPIYYCVQCDAQFQRQSDFKRHVKMGHKQIKSIPCPKCEKVFRYPSKLAEHLVVHSDKKPFSCKFCYRQFARSADQKKHMFSHSKHTYSASLEYTRESSKPKDKHITTLKHVDVSDKHKETLFLMNQKKEITIKKNDHFCFLCSEPFTSKLELQHHQATVHCLNNVYQCLKCRVSFSDLSKLLEHNSKHSSKMKSSKISSNENFSRRPTLNDRTHQHSSVEPKLLKDVHKSPHPKFEYSCAVCAKTFQWPSRLKDHMLTHTKEKCFTCDHCKRGFARKYDLIYHMSKHVGHKMYSCPICKMAFVSSSLVDRHISSHSQVPLYACSLCHKSFNLLKHLEKHISRHYLNATGQSCVVCHKKFALTSSLRSHMLIHLHGKSFACPLCRRHFFNSSALRVHLQNIHKKYQLNSEIFQETKDSKNGLCHEVAETSIFNSERDKVLGKDEIGVQSNDVDGDPLDVLKSPVCDSGQIRVIEASVVQENKESSNNMVADLIKVSDTKSGDGDTDTHHSSGLPSE